MQETMQILFDFGIKFNLFIENNPDSFYEALCEKNFDLVKVLLNDITNINEQTDNFTPIMTTFTLLSDKDLTENEINNYMKIIYLLCQNKDIKIDSPSYNYNNALNYAMNSISWFKALTNDFHKGFIEFLIKKGARKFHGQELKPDEIMKKFDEEVARKQPKNFLNNPIVNLLSQGFNSIGAELINKISNGVVSLSLDILKNVL